MQQNADSLRGLRPGPSMEKLKQKYGGDEALGAEAAEDAAEPDDVTVRQVRSKKTGADPANDPGQRAIIISKRKGLLGSQG